MNFLRFLDSQPFKLYYEGETESDGNNTEGDPPVDDLPASAKGKTSFTQEELNRILKEDRKKHQVQLQKQKAETDKQIKALEQLQKSSTLTAKDKQTLEAQLEELRNSQLTEKQLAEKEKARLETAHKTTVQSLTAERDAWQNRFVKSTINTAIVGEAVRVEAFDPDAFIALLGPNTRLVEDTDSEGKPIESFIPKVKFSDTDKDGKPVTLDLTVEQAVKRMKEMPRYAYLFKSTATGGLGGQASAGKGTVDISKMTMKQYLAHRKTQ